MNFPPCWQRRVVQAVNQYANAEIKSESVYAGADGNIPDPPNGIPVSDMSPSQVGDLLKRTKRK